MPPYKNQPGWKYATKQEFSTLIAINTSIIYKNLNLYFIYNIPTLVINGTNEISILSKYVKNNFSFVELSSVFLNIMFPAQIGRFQL